MDSKIIVLRLTPGFDYNILKLIVEQGQGIRGIIIEMFGSGNSLVTSVFLEAIREAKRRGIVVVAATQCLQGGVSLDIVRALLFILTKHYSTRIFNYDYDIAICAVCCWPFNR